MLDVEHCRLVREVKPRRVNRRTPRRQLPEISQSDHAAALARVSAGLAHDFNNVLTVIMGNVQLAQSATTPKKQQKFLAEAALGCRYAEQMVRRLRAIGRNQQPTLQAFDLISVITQAVSLHASPALKLAHVKRDNCDERNCIIFGDGTELFHAVTNLILNAREAVGPCGTVTLKLLTKRVRRATELLSCEIAPGHYAIITVTDTGSGMPPHVLKHAIEPYFTTKLVGSGFGMGLAQVTAFALTAGGGLHIESPVRESSGVTFGTCATLYVPVDRDVSLRSPAIWTVTFADQR